MKYKRKSIYNHRIHKNSLKTIISQNNKSFSTDASGAFKNSSIKNSALNISEKALKFILNKIKTLISNYKDSLKEKIEIITLSNLINNLYPILTSHMTNLINSMEKIKKSN